MIVALLAAAAAAVAPSGGADRPLAKVQKCRAVPCAGKAVRRAPRDPWFLTMYARDAGNGDFRLHPAPGAIPAGRLVLSYKNLDETAHDLRLRAPGAPERVLFAASATHDLRRTELDLAAGDYELLCGLAGHERMRQPFVVTP